MESSLLRSSLPGWATFLRAALVLMAASINVNAESAPGFDQCPMAESPWSSQAFNGEKFVLSNKQKRHAYDPEEFTVTQGKP